MPQKLSCLILSAILLLRQDGDVSLETDTINTVTIGVPERYYPAITQLMQERKTNIRYDTYPEVSTQVFCLPEDIYQNKPTACDIFIFPSKAFCSLLDRNGLGKVSEGMVKVVQFLDYGTIPACCEIDHTIQAVPFNARSSLIVYDDTKRRFEESLDIEESLHSTEDDGLLWQYPLEDYRYGLTFLMMQDHRLQVNRDEHGNLVYEVDFDNDDTLEAARRLFRLIQNPRLDYTRPKGIGLSIYEGYELKVLDTDDLRKRLPANYRVIPMAGDTRQPFPSLPTTFDYLGVRPDLSEEKLMKVWHIGCLLTTACIRDYLAESNLFAGFSKGDYHYMEDKTSLMALQTVQLKACAFSDSFLNPRFEEPYRIFFRHLLTSDEETLERRLTQWLKALSDSLMAVPVIEKPIP